MSVAEEIADLMSRYGLEISEKKKSVVKGTHSELPISLVAKIQSAKKTIIVELVPEEDLSDVLADMIESGEDVEEAVDSIIAELRDVAIEISRRLEDSGYKVILKLREGERDIRDLLEEVTEEYSEEVEE
ncbi:MAG: hypothetical protein ABWW65_03265 [Thermoprotei archaeon]